MTILGIVVAVLVIGFCWWLIDQVPSIDPTFKKIAKGVLIFAFVLWLLAHLGVLHHGVLDQPLT